MKLFFPLVCGVIACLGGCAGVGGEPSASPCAFLLGPPPATTPAAQTFARWRHRVDRYAGRVRDDLRLVADRTQLLLDSLGDSRAMQCLLPAVCVAAVVAAAACGHCGSVNLSGLGGCAASP